MSCDSAAEPLVFRLRSIRIGLYWSLLLLTLGCSRRDASPPAEGYWYPEEILAPAERRDESEAKIARLTEWARQQGHGGVLLSTPANFAWVTAGGDSRIRDSACGEGVAQLFFGSDGRRILIARCAAFRDEAM